MSIGKVKTKIPLDAILVDLERRQLLSS